jgi:hypothetical protein
MYNTVQESQEDIDFGSGGALVLPDISVSANKKVHLVVGAGKDGNIYVADRDNMGKWNPSNNNNVYQELTAALPYGAFSAPAYFHNTVYIGANMEKIYAYPIVNGRLATSPSSVTAHGFFYPGTSPSISSNHGQDGILWGVDNSSPFVLNAVLYAYDALDLTRELYNSHQQAGRDQLGQGNKFMTPMIANGRVYIGMLNGVAVFGLLK